MNIDQAIQDYRRVSTPLMLIGCPDNGATMTRVAKLFDNNESKTPIPMVRWDCHAGCSPMNDAGKAALVDILQSDDQEQWSAQTANPVTALATFLKMPGEIRGSDGKIRQRGSMIFALNLQEMYEASTPAGVNAAQGVWNLRDPFKKTRRTLYVLGNRHVPPAILRRDAIILNETVPDDVELAAIVKAQTTAAGYEAITDGEMSSAVDALRSLSAFTAEQIAAMASDKKGVDIEAMWDSKVADIATTKGLSVDTVKVTEEDLGGMEWLVKMFTRLASGPACPKVVVRIDEIEKMFGGLSGAGDNTGVTQDTLGVVLKFMEDNDADGVILVGGPGTGKTLVSRMASYLFSKISKRKVLPLAADLGDTKTSRLGDTEKAVRDLFDRVISLGGKGGVFFIATCNDLDVLPAPLRRRFTKGIWYVDLPTEKELDNIWTINLKKFGLDPKMKRPDCKNWTGAEVRNCCRNAYQMGTDLLEAAKLIVPVCKSAPGDIEKLRRLADGKFNSVSYEGAYKANKTNTLTETVTAGTSTRRRGEED
jgi:hypothetical protein